MKEQLSIEFEEFIPVYYQIVRRIKSLISSGEIRAGDRIPPEETLAKQWGINRGTVNKAINHLAGEGILYRRRGQGTFVTPYSKKKTRTLAVLLYNIDDPFYSRIVKGISDETAKNGYHLILYNTFGEEEKEQEYIEKLIEEEKVDGFLFCPRKLDLTSPVFDIFEEKSIPVVVFPQASEKINGHTVNYVLADDESGAYRAVKHLLGLGHRDIGFITSDDWTNKAVIDRWNGYKRALEEKGVEVRRDYVFETEGVGIEDGWIVAERKIDAIRTTTAVFCIADTLAIGVLKRLRSMGVRVPEEISVVGFDNIDMAGSPDICLTTVEQPTYLIGRKSADVLITHIEGKAKESAHVVLPTKLIVRETTGRR